MGVAMICANIAAPAFAEAPVYDADSMPQDQDYAPPPDQAQYMPQSQPQLQGQEGGGGFVPMQVQPSVTVSSPAPSQPATSTLSVEQRVQRMEQQLNNMQTSDASTRVESLQTQVQTLRGEIEKLAHSLELVQAQQKSMYTDLDGRVTQASTAKSVRASASPAISNDAAPAPAVIKAASKSGVKSRADIVDSFSAKPVGSQPNVAEEQQIYQSAYNLIKAKKYSEAVSTLQSMLKKYPSGQFASNAHYWLGELYGLLGKSDQALTEFAAVVKTYPDSPRVSDAQLKVGLIYASELKWPDAKAALKKVVSHYPGSPSARLASEQLKQIKQAGH